MFQQPGSEGTRSATRGSQTLQMWHVRPDVPAGELLQAPPTDAQRSTPAVWMRHLPSGILSDRLFEVAHEVSHRSDFTWRIFIHSFIQTIYIAPLQVPFYSEALPTQHGYCAGVSLWVKDLPNVPTWQLERESNPRPSGWKLSTQPMRHHVHL